MATAEKSLATVTIFGGLLSHYTLAFRRFPLLLRVHVNVSKPLRFINDSEQK